MTRPTVLSSRGLCKQYSVAQRVRAPHVALEDLSFEVGLGEFVCIVGPSGCGKSTLLNLVAGLDLPTLGQLLLDGRPIQNPGSDRGVVFQKDCLFPWLTVAENVEFALGLARHRALPKAEVRARARSLLRAVGLERCALAYPRELSGGMRQRAAIARALLQQPRILLMDEPFGALDAETREQMQELVSGLCQAEATTALFVTHDVEEATFLGDRVLVMSAPPGRLLEIEVPLPRPRSPDLKFQPAFAELRGRVARALRAGQPRLAS